MTPFNNRLETRWVECRAELAYTHIAAQRNLFSGRAAALLHLQPEPGWQPVGISGCGTQGLPELTRANQAGGAPNHQASRQMLSPSPRHKGTL